METEGAFNPSASLPGNILPPQLFSYHPFGVHAEYIENAPPGTVIGIDERLDRCAVCGLLYRPVKDNHPHEPIVEPPTKKGNEIA